MTLKLETLTALACWDDYRALTRRRLKQLPDGDCPIYISKERFEFDHQGQPWRGVAVLFGPKSPKAAQKLRKEGLLFRSGVCRSRGRDLEVTGISENAIQLAEFTFKRLRVGWSIVAGGPRDAARDTGPTSATDPRAAQLAARQRALAGEVKTIAGLGRRELLGALRRAVALLGGVRDDLAGGEMLRAQVALDDVAALVASLRADSPRAADEPLNAKRSFELTAAVGRGGKNLVHDVETVQAALNRRLGVRLAVDGRCGKPTIAAIEAFQRALGQARPDGRVDPRRGTARALAAAGRVGSPPPPPQPMQPPKLGPPSLAAAPKVWRGARTVLAHNVKELKRAITQEYSSEHPDLRTEIDQHVARVDVILAKLDHRLAQSLDRANTAADDAAREEELAGAHAILAEYVQFVKTEPLIGHVDRNPFGVDTQLRRVITDSLTNMARSIGRPVKR